MTPGGVPRRSVAPIDGGRQGEERARHMVDLRSDACFMACPEVLQQLSVANRPKTTNAFGGRIGGGSGDDPDATTATMLQQVARVFKRDPATLGVFPVATGTAANALALSTICPPHGLVYGVDGTHAHRCEPHCASLALPWQAWTVSCQWLSPPTV